MACMCTAQCPDMTCLAAVKPALWIRVSGTAWTETLMHVDDKSQKYVSIVDLMEQEGMLALAPQ